MIDRIVDFCQFLHTAIWAYRDAQRDPDNTACGAVVDRNVACLTVVVGLNRGAWRVHQDFAKLYGRPNE